MPVAQVCISALSSSETLDAEGLVCVYKSGVSDNDSFGKPILVQENVDGFDDLVILWAWDIRLRAHEDNGSFS